MFDGYRAEMYPGPERLTARPSAFNEDDVFGLVTKQEVEFHNEFRAVYTTPASLLDSDEDRKRGHVVNRTAWFKSPIEAKKRAMVRCEENHAYITDIEMSWVTRSKPESIGK